ncbi:hypothetical protein L218DRAFT_949046 [Marasmius fiardii PR-910]|nr:hypothetical protein L218DRAFT_949046 [Marasmius fiardii PR-910]
MTWRRGNRGEEKVGGIFGFRGWDGKWISKRERTEAFNERLVGVDVISDGREIIGKELGLVNDTSISSLDLNYSCKVNDYHRFSIVGKGGVGEVGAGYRDEVASLEKGHGGKYISTSNSLTSTAEEAENDEDGQDGVVTILPSLKLSNLKDVSLEDEWSELMFTVDVETPMMEPSSNVVSSSPEIDFGRHQRGIALKTADNAEVETSDGNANSDSNTKVKTKVDQGSEPKPESEQRQSFISSSSTRNVDIRQRIIDISALVIPAQGLCFLPWCIAVGCALLAFPKSRAADF